MKARKWSNKIDMDVEWQTISRCLPKDLDCSKNTSNFNNQSWLHFPAVYAR